jgi:hypothetical protein
MTKNPRILREVFEERCRNLLPEKMHTIAIILHMRTRNSPWAIGWLCPTIEANATWYTPRHATIYGSDLALGWQKITGLYWMLDLLVGE